MDVNIVKKTQDTAKEFTKNMVMNILPSPRKCPKKCKPRRGRVGSESEVDMDGNEVWLDNSENKWESGDVPDVGGDELGYKKLGSDVEPKAYYGGAKNNTQYVCRWNGDSTKMTNMNKGLEFTTTIPCKFFPGYETVSKF